MLRRPAAKAGLLFFVDIIVEKFGKRWNKMEKYS